MMMMMMIYEVFVLVFVVHGSFCSVFSEREPEIVSKVENVTVTVGRNALLSCKVNNLGHYNVAWIKVDTQTILTVQKKVIINDLRFRVTQNNHKTWYLHIKNVKYEDKGYYMCQVNTKPMRSQNGYLQVLVPPAIVQKGTSDDIVVKEFGSVSLHCEATGHPFPTITWEREDNKRIFTGWSKSHTTREETIEGEYLNLTRVTRNHMGAYLCIAFNGVPPPVSKRIVLKVDFPPRIRVPNQLVGAPLHSQVTLECEVEGHPKPMTIWKKYNELIVSSDRHTVNVEDSHPYKMLLTLKIISLQQRDYGAYKCRAINAQGEREGLIRLYETLANTADTPRAYKGHPDKIQSYEAEKNNSNSKSVDYYNVKKNKSSSKSLEIQWLYPVLYLLMSANL